MLFRMPRDCDLGSIKGASRRFEDFYLESLRRLIETFGRVALWCDDEVAEFLRANKLDKKIIMRVMKFSDLPDIKNKSKNLNILRGMQNYPGYMMKNKTADNWIDYLPIVLAKGDIIKWAEHHDTFNSDYFMWIDAGCFNDLYAQCWENWPGCIAARPKRCRFCVTPELVKPRPKFIPGIVHNIYKKIRRPRPDMTIKTLAKQSMRDIAMINADYEIPGGTFIIPKKLVMDFYTKFSNAVADMRENNLIGADQSVFLQMMKSDTQNMFELCRVNGYKKIYTKMVAEFADYDL